MALTMNFNLGTVARRITDQQIFGRPLLSNTMNFNTVTVITGMPDKR